MDSIIAWGANHWNDILAIYGAVVALATVIVKITPTQADDAILGKITGFVEIFSHIKKPDPSSLPTEKTEK